MANSVETHKHTKPFYLARLMLALYLSLVAYASITPFNFRIETPLMPWEWLLAPVPKYIPIFDVVTNVIGYLPFGFLMIFTLYSIVTRWPALLATLLLGAIFSGLLESFQTYLPTRIPSPIDWYSNMLGVLIGALFALPLSPQWLSGNKAERVREAIFGNHQGFFLLMILCPLAQIYPQNAWLGMGDLGLSITRISPYWTLPLDNASQEILITSLATLSIGTLFLYGIRKSAPAVKIIGILLCIMVMIKFFISQFQFVQTGASSWWSLSVLIGLIVGYILTFLAHFLSKKSQWTLSLMALLSLIILVNVLPNNPYFHNLLEQLPQGKMMHVNGLFGWISIVWPLLAICLLLKNRKANLQ